MLNTDASRLRCPRKNQKTKTWVQSGNQRHPRPAAAWCLGLLRHPLHRVFSPLMRACFIFLGEDYCLAGIRQGGEIGGCYRTLQKK
ncbi:MAG TPA: hypothetical protein VE092_16670 [Herbaspirillum sp.]|uniref:hypothetical protein n=1 Tax=Herbaspirillum sp. TaxID=1890675 RepID=UPI002D58E939|nr:hypothetical protein [Herbaspirillum sp.]HZG21644.1 hypothetical protein [Herbaspirillum sp.]